MNNAGAAGRRSGSPLTARRALTLVLAAGGMLIGLLPGGTGLASAGTLRPAVTSLRVTTVSLPDATGGHVYTAKLAAAGGIRPYTWSITEGALPAGLTLVPTTGLINGRPATPGGAAFTVQVTDAANPAATATADLSITVTVPPVTVTTSTLPAGIGGVAYSAKLTASGGARPYTWSVSSGSLPAGLTLHPATGAITGTPSGGGTAAFTVQVTDAQDPASTATASLSIAVGVQPLVVTTISNLPTATPGVPYSVRFDAAGGVAPYTWSIIDGSLPAGLTLHPGGLISGTPTAVGTASFAVAVTDSDSPQGRASAGESLTVTTPLTVTSSVLPGAIADTPYSATLTAAGGVPPYFWTVNGQMPPGLVLNLLTGEISGNPTTDGTFTFTAQVSDHSVPAAMASAQVSITVAG
ncbi:MAG TPA: Ig domain-containing protein [Streptosporangiaceae bacterium]